MTRRLAVLAALFAAAFAQAQEFSPFLTDPEALERRYGLGGEGAQRALGPSEGAVLDPARPSRRQRVDPRRRSEPGSVGSDVVDERSVVQPGAKPFLRF